ncbi:hypothetical protein J4Q44_G00073010 [Coregonus suidteri]|uniref:Uncharacterized protein n=1 Tax=Coregonus suidteri TaxID=861788 RepID=A0AAN8M5B3_9TELE
MSLHQQRREGRRSTHQSSHPQAPTQSTPTLQFPPIYRLPRPHQRHLKAGPTHTIHRGALFSSQVIMVTTMDMSSSIALGQVMDIVTNTAPAMDTVMGTHMPLKPLVTGIQWLNIYILNIPTSVHCLCLSVPPRVSQQTCQSHCQDL